MTRKSLGQWLAATATTFVWLTAAGAADDIAADVKGQIVAEGYEEHLWLTGAWEASPQEGKALDAPPDDAGRAWEIRQLPEFWATALGRDRKQLGDWLIYNLKNPDGSPLVRPENRWPATDSIWYRRDVEIPPAWSNRVVELRFERAGYRVKVWVNGQYAGQHMGSDTPWKLDVTKLLSPGKTNRIVLGLTNISAGMTGDYCLIRDGWKYPLDTLTEGPVDTGCSSGLTGVWRPFKLAAVPQARIEDVFVISRVGAGELEVRAEVIIPRHRWARIGVEILDGDKVVKTFAPKTVLGVPSRQVYSLVFREPFPNARPWWPDDPHLYQARVSLALPQGPMDETGLLQTFSERNARARQAPDDNRQHTKTARFGYREVAVDGHRLMLNGKRLFCAGESIYAPVSRRHAERGPIPDIKNVLGANAMRIHVSVPPDEVIEYCDEIGLLLMVQFGPGAGESVVPAAGWTHKQTTWAEHVRAWRNHPSIAVWCTDNEATMHYTRQAEAGFPHLHGTLRLQEIAHALDPTRPVLTGHGADLHSIGGPMDIYSVGGPVNMPPNVGVEEFFLMGMGQENWDRNKPLMGDEWAPQEFRGLVCGYGGEEVFNDNGRREPGLFGGFTGWWAYNWYFDMLEIRKQDAYSWLGGYSVGYHRERWPTIMRHAWGRFAFAPETWKRGLPAGKTVPLAFRAINDTHRPVAARARWELIEHPEDKATAKGKVDFDIAGNSHRIVDLPLPVPAMKADEARRAWTLKVSVTDRNDPARELTTCEHEVFALPMPDFAALPPFDLYDPANTATATLARAGLRHRRIARIEEADLARPLIVASGFAGTVREEETERIEDFVRRGGRALQLRQDRLNSPFLGVPLWEENLRHFTYGFDIAFAVGGGHPALGRLDRQDIRFWGAGKRVGAVLSPKPKLGNFRAIAQAANSNIYWPHAKGLTLAPMIEIRDGAGTAILCQLYLLENLIEEPAAAEIFAATLRYLASPQPALKPVVVLGASPYPDAMGVWRADHGLDKATPQNTAAVALDGRRGDFAELLRQHAADLKRYAEAGGTVLLHWISPTNAAAVNEVFETALELEALPAAHQTPRGMVPASGEVFPDPLTRGMGNFELFWDAGLGHFGRVTPGASLAVADFQITKTADDVVVPIAPGLLAWRPLGKGRLVVDQVRWHVMEAPAATEAQATHPRGIDVEPWTSATPMDARIGGYISMLLNNLDVGIRPPQPATLVLNHGLVSGALPHAARLDPAVPARAGAPSAAGQSWKAVRLQTNPASLDGNLLRELGLEDARMSAIYFEATVESPADQTVQLAVRHPHSDIEGYVNGQRVLQGTYRGEAAPVEIGLREGVNRITVRLVPYRQPGLRIELRGGRFAAAAATVGGETRP